MLETILLVGAVMAMSSSERPLETWQCEANADGLPQQLEVRLDGDRLVEFSYVGLTPAGDGTFLSCSLAADRRDSKSVWTEEGPSLHIRLKDSAAEDDEVHVTREGRKLIFEFKVSPFNCGHSSARAARLSIARGKRTCRDVEIAD